MRTRKRRHPVQHIVFEHLSLSMVIRNSPKQTKQINVCRVAARATAVICGHGNAEITVQLRATAPGVNEHFGTFNVHFRCSQTLAGLPWNLDF